MKEDVRLLIEETRVIQQEYEHFTSDTELKIQKFNGESNDLINELKATVAKADDILYSLSDQLKKGIDIVEQIKNLDDKLLANDLLLIFKEVCMNFKDFVIDHSKLTKEKAQVIMDKSSDYIEVFQKAVNFQATIAEKFQSRTELQNRLVEEKEKLRGL